MTDSLHAALLIAVMSLMTIGLRALPFLLLSGKRKVPRKILYLGEVLPGAALGMLVIYCLRDLTFTAPAYGSRELLSCAAVVLVQMKKRNTIYSILAGTLLYMLLLHI